MARIRTIKPEFWTDEDLAGVSEAALLLAAALLNYADDEGYFNANPGLIKAACFPLREPSVKLHVSLTELSNIRYLEIGTVIDGKRYGHIRKFLDHQRISHAKESKIKDLQISWEDVRNTCGIRAEGSEHDPRSLGPEGKGMEGNGREGKRDGAEAPADFKDLKTRLWSEWKALPDGGGGAFLGKLAKDHDEQRLLEGVERTLEHAPADSKSFLVGVLRKPAPDDWMADVGEVI